MTVVDLIRRLEAATEPDRRLDVEIWNALNVAMLHYTGSIDAALMLVPPGWAWSVESSTEYGSYGGCSPNAPYDEWVHSDMGGFAIYAATPAIALCISALRARAATMGDGDTNAKSRSGERPLKEKCDD